MDPVEFEGAGERYKYLLQPVKSLASNFDTDIVALLEEYIKKVLKIFIKPKSIKYLLLRLLMNLMKMELMKLESVNCKLHIISFFHFFSFY
jgi:hypothetical protein